MTGPGAPVPTGSPRPLTALDTAGQEVKGVTIEPASVDVLVPIGAHDALALGLVGGDGSWLVATLDRETG